MLDDQVKAAFEKKSASDRLTKVVLVGGFGDSPAVRESIQACLVGLSKLYNTAMTLVVAPNNMSATGVASGAIMRAREKHSCPKRIPHRSIGVRRHIIPEKNIYPREVLAQRASLAEVSNNAYIMDTILWLIKAVSHAHRRRCRKLTNCVVGSG